MFAGSRLVQLARRAGQLGLISLVGLLCLCALGSSAHAKERNGHRPWGRGTLAPSVGGGFAYSSELTVPTFGVGVSYFAFDGVSFGLTLDDSMLIYSRQLKGRLFEISSQLPTNIARVLPTVQWVFLRRPRFSPYVSVGLGPALFNNGHGVFGNWVLGPGVLIAIAGPVYLDLGVAFSGFFPRGRCNAGFVYKPNSDAATAIDVLDYCSFRWSARLGVVVAFGG